MYSPDRIDAVVFDMGGVFVIPSPHVVSGIVARAGVALELDDATARLAHYAGIASISRALDAHEIDESSALLWEFYDAGFFGAAGLAGPALAAAIEARSEARITGDSAAIWNHVLPENAAAFAEIATRRPVAVVTNNNGTAVQQCLELSLCQVGPGPLCEVATIVDSGVLGIAKPDPRIFAPALDALGTDAGRTLYVGDTVHADVRGAEAAGMPVVQLDPFDFHADHGHWRLPDVVALVAHLA